ncbi:hypothetical protein SAMN04489712_111132 [Thermomonospora echinospora]|uniref:Neocarzinostatin family protein n=2 Tax=Thermomonospora echinospora TaxID=1992 RepID=A0A1H6CTA2_9ACTN|nr:hypothetical protein SAMN04489712_111132 [Thermomonospora echinospora]
MKTFKPPLLLGVLGLAAWIAPSAYADGVSATGPRGQTLTISKAADVAADGEKITVTGRGFDTGKGVYVAFCRDNGPGKAPSPCGGGADTTGSTGGSHWVSSNPPPYGRNLAVPYGEGGSFEVTITVSAKLSDTVDCTEVKCVVATRADHTRSADRSQDVRVPVSFAEPGGPAGVSPVWWAGGGAVIIAAAGGILLLRRRSRAAEPEPGR